MLAVLQTFVCCFIAYGLAKYKFKGNGVIFLLVIVTMIIPNRTLSSAMSMNFTYFDVAGILSFLSGGASVGIESIDSILASINILDLPDHSINLKNTIWPFIIISVTGLAFKNGLYIFMLRQFFRGIPDSLEESAYIDGSGDFRTFIQIILPMSVPMMITVFLFAFCWQWTDSFYTEMFFTSQKDAPNMLAQMVDIPKSLDTEYAGQNLYETAIRNTCGIMIIAPLVILYVFLQRYLVEGIERSGLTAE
jgi:multiple sugar transport system permease protein